MPKKASFLQVYNSFAIQGQNFVRGLYKGEIVVFMLVLALFDKSEVVSKHDVIKSNKAIKRDTTYAHLYALERKGFLSSVKSDKYYSKSYLSLTPKGLLLRSSISRFLLTSSLHLPGK